ncbi:N-acetylmuramic acid 6-phosphate etherase [Gluconacetobacter tumulisoli]|uniref:N-acetylmuramic acid 6-phosphate etherase n=1 Tax=Gluconacetobacter tumulisoli TaxID=1286189 RepID=A0A7W4PJJ0_9PROT|nr:N-acetylmuramic acid 6-phosphate etherase [Gluconacetobacter tumulisoli]MBB2200377.1 N-acetylmuramic acid 6-phosphate etherase [Gluconacetobacter tumulisoli]
MTSAPPPPTAIPATEAFSPATADLDTWPVPVQVASLWEGQMTAVAAIRPALSAIATAVEAALPRLRAGGRLVYAGAGSSGRLAAQDGAELEPTFDWPASRTILLIAGGPRALTEAVENAEDDTDSARHDMQAAGVGPNDVLIALAASGRTPYTLACVRTANDVGALTIGVANSAGSALLDSATHPILLETGAEAIAGSTRMKAGTSQKIVLNLLSTAMMVGLGRVHAGRMVDMRARNEKLRHRAVRMVRDLTGCTAEAAASALAGTDGRVKPAILVVHGLTPDDAASTLARHDGVLRAALRSVTAGTAGV